MFGTMIAMWPSRDAMQSLKPTPAYIARVALVSAMVLLSFSPLILQAVETHTDWGSSLRYKHIPTFEDDGTPQAMRLDK